MRDPVTTMTVNPIRVHGRSRPVISETGTRRIVQPSSRRSFIITVPKKRATARTWEVSMSGQASVDSSRATLQGVLPSHSRNRSMGRRG